MIVGILVDPIVDKVGEVSVSNGLNFGDMAGLRLLVVKTPRFMIPRRT